MYKKKEKGKKLSKVFLSVLVVAILVVVLPVNTYAGTSTPKTNWNLKSDGQYNFSGQANNSKLYTNYRFTGVGKAKISVRNHNSSVLVVKIVEVGTGIAGTNKTIQTVRIPAKGTTTWTNSDFKSSKKYYLTFGSPSDFSGYIKKA